MKLYVIVEAALTAGAKAAQAIHAFRAFIDAYPDIEQRWFLESNRIVVLQTVDVPTLADKLAARGLNIAQFTDEDLGRLTAIAAEPAAARYLSSLPLAT